MLAGKSAPIISASRNGFRLGASDRLRLSGHHETGTLIFPLRRLRFRSLLVISRARGDLPFYFFRRLSISIVPEQGPVCFFALLAFGRRHRQTNNPVPHPPVAQRAPDTSLHPISTSHQAFPPRAIRPRSGIGLVLEALIRTRPRPDYKPSSPIHVSTDSAIDSPPPLCRQHAAFARQRRLLLSVGGIRQ